MSRTFRILGFLLLLAVAATLRLWQIDRLPPGFHFDESFEGLEAWRILTDPTYRPVFLTGNFGVPPLNAYANALTFALAPFFGGEPGPTAMRVTSAVMGVLGVVAVFALGSEMRRYAPAHLSAAFPWLAAGSLALMRWHLHFSRMGIEPVMVPVVWAGATWLLLRAWRTGSWWSYAACGATLALGMYTYQGAWVVPLLVAATAGYLLWREEGETYAKAQRRKEQQGTERGAEGLTLRARRVPAQGRLQRRKEQRRGKDAKNSGDGRGAGRQVPDASPVAPFWKLEASRKVSPRVRRWAGLGIAAGVAVIGVAPLAVFFAGRPDLLLLRPAQLAIVGETASPADSTLLGAIWATAKMFGPLGSPGDLDPRRNLPGAPALTVWQALPFYVGLALALRRMAAPVFALLVVGLAGLLAPGVISEYAPHFHRILGASAPAALLIGVGLDAIAVGAVFYHTSAPDETNGAPRGPLKSSPERGDSLPLARNDSRVPVWLGAVVVAALVLLAGATTVRDYFVRWASLPDLYYAFDVGLWDVGRWVAAQPAETPVYLTPRAADHATLAFAWRERAQGSRAPVTFDGRAVFPLTEVANETAEEYAVILHEDWRTPLLLPDVLPDAAVTQVFDDYAGQPYAQVYTRSAGTVPVRPPHVSLDLALGDGLTLLGYDLQPADLTTGGTAYLQLHWRVEAAPATAWSVFVHLLDESGAQVGGFDRPAGAGTLPTIRWQPGWRVLDEAELALPPDRDLAGLRLAVGLYGKDGTRLPADGPGIVIPVQGTAP